MVKNRRDFGGTYAFSLCAVKKIPPNWSDYKRKNGRAERGR